ncbi:helix-turn-helix domain-containing protein, partial [Escherichia coli]
MSMELMVKAMKIRVGNPLRKLVLIKLADNASDQGECWPSYQHIADQCEISKRSVMNHIAALCESGLKWFTEFGHLNRGDMLTSEQHRCHNEKKK